MAVKEIIIKGEKYDPYGDCKFGFVRKSGKKEYTLVRGVTHGCKDYLPEMIRSELYKGKERAEKRNHGYDGGKRDKDTINLKKTYLYIRAEAMETENETKQRIYEIQNLINVLDRKLGWQNTIFKFAKITEKKKEMGGKVTFIVIADKCWQLNPHMLSLLCLFIRFFTNDTVKIDKVTNTEELWKYLRKLKDSTRYNRDSGYLSNVSSLNGEKIITNYYEIFGDAEIKKDLYPNTDNYPFHSDSGISSLCCGKASSSKIRERIQKLKTR